MGNLLRTILLIFSLFVFSSAFGSDKTPCVVVHVIDGDTFSCRLNSGEEVRVRLIGIDAPETSDNPKAIRDAQRTGQSLEEITRMGRMAKEFAERLLPRGERVFLEFDVQRTDRYGRLLAYVWLPDGRLLNEILVEEGYAIVYTPNSKPMNTAEALLKIINAMRPTCNPMNDVEAITRAIIYTPPHLLMNMRYEPTCKPSNEFEALLEIANTIIYTPPHKLMERSYNPIDKPLNEFSVEEDYVIVNVKYQERLLRAQSRARENRKGLWRMQ